MPARRQQRRLLLFFAAGSGHRDARHLRSRRGVEGWRPGLVLQGRHPGEHAGLASQAAPTSSIYDSSEAAPNWRIHTGIKQGDTAATTEMNLALALGMMDRNVEFETVWGQGHTMTTPTSSSGWAPFSHGPFLAKTPPKILVQMDFRKELKRASWFLAKIRNFLAI